METEIFDGRAYAAELEEGIKSKVGKLVTKPKLVSLLVGENPASKLFLSLKQKAAERVGILVDVVNFREDSNPVSMNRFIDTLNKDGKVTGIMVQLPIPKGFSQERIINAIKPEKDVDGMRDDSPFTAPVVKAVWSAIVASGIQTKKVVVIGVKGFVGQKLISFLAKKSFTITPLDLGAPLTILKDSDLVISATGSEGLIKGSMIKKSAVLIDVGSPKGDIDKDSIVGIASFLSPVPGGVGPVTIAYLLENLVQ